MTAWRYDSCAFYELSCIYCRKRAKFYRSGDLMHFCAGPASFWMMSQIYKKWNGKNLEAIVIYIIFSLPSLSPVPIIRCWGWLRLTLRVFSGWFLRLWKLPIFPFQYWSSCQFVLPTFQTKAWLVFYTASQLFYRRIHSSRVMADTLGGESCKNLNIDDRLHQINS